MSIKKPPRLYIKSELAPNQLLTLLSEQNHYVQNVMRLKVGDTLRLFNGEDGEWHATISHISKQECKVIPLTLHRAQLHKSDLWLCPAPIKKAPFDYMIEKASELGVSVIEPIITQHTQVREVNIDRLQSIAIESSEQSERLTVPEIKKPLSFETMLKNWPKDRILIVAAEFGEAAPINEVFKSLRPEQKAKAGILIGPEGGFAKEELDMARKIETAHLVRLGPRILRADTAAIATLTCFQALCGDWTSHETPVT